MAIEIETRAARDSDLAALAGLIGRYWEHEGIANFDAAEQRALLGRLLAEPRLGRVFVAGRGAALFGYRIGG
jgi:hypothetical protein